MASPFVLVGQADSLTVSPYTLATKREGTSAVWISGSGAGYVFGGRDSVTWMTDVLKYQPVQGESGNLPVVKAMSGSGRAYTAAFSDGTNAFVFGGIVVGTGSVSKISKYAPAGSGTWTDTLHGLPGTLAARYSASAVWTGALGYALFIGGSTDQPSDLNEILRYFPSTGAIDVFARLPTIRTETSAVWDPRVDPRNDGTCTQGCVYVFGGYGNGTAPNKQVVRIDVAAPANNRVTLLAAQLPTGRRDTSAVFDGEYAYVFGGRNCDGACVYVDQILRFDPVANTVQVQPDTLPSTRSRMGALWDGSAAVLFGGIPDVGINLATRQIVVYGLSPNVPTSFTATRGPAAGQISLAWTPDLGPAVAEYKIYRATTSGGQGPTPTAMTSNPNSYIDGVGLTPGQRYYYKIQATNAYGASVLSAETSARAPSGPDAPTALDAVMGDVPRQTRLTWVAPLDDGGFAITGYTVYRGTQAGQENTNVGTTNAATLNFIDSGPLLDNTTYFYKVSATNSFGEGAKGAGDSATTGARPWGPRSVAAVMGTVPGQIKLTWLAPTSDGGFPVVNYTVYRSDVAGGPYGLVATPGNVLAWNDANVPNGAARFYRVSATNAVGEGALSAESTAQAPNVSAAPGNLVATAPAPSQIRLTWSTPANGGLAITAYRIYRGNATGATPFYTEIGPATTWTDTPLPDGTTRFYRVSAVNAAGESALTPEVNKTTAQVPTAPQNLRTTRGPGVGQIKVDWNAPSFDGGLPITNYRIERADTAQGPFAQVAVVGNVLTWTDGGLPNAATKFYRVTAVNAVGPGNVTTAVFGQAPDVPVAAVNLVAAPGTLPGDVVLTWTAPGNNGMSITDYAIYRTTVETGETVRFLAADADSTETDGLLPGVRYYYRIAAINGVGEGPKSNEASARAALLPVSLDGDGDTIPQLVEQRVCGTQLIRDVMESPVYDALGPVIGECASASDWQPLIFVDADEDMVPDAAEPVLCLLEDQNDVLDGICVGSDYGLPPI